ncbi:MAG: exosortase C-terminal domain/associated protein EpsI [Chthoniobacteraceae bacterium]
MTTSRLTVLLAFVALGFSSVFLLPRSGAQPSGIVLELPDFVGNWKGTEAPILEVERATLGERSGTEFARKTYRNLEGYEVLVSIVLSGRDMSTSIHRPERCLKAQGWTVQESDSVAVSLASGGVFPVTQLRNTRLVRGEGEAVQRELQTYYWFVGSDHVSASHWSRWAIDNRDRLLRGENQRWAFILVSGVVPLPSDPNQIGASRRWAQNTIREFIKTLAPKIHRDTVRYD